MARKDADPAVPIEKRKEIFLAVANAQESGQTIAAARLATAKQFAVPEAVVKSIEAEGADNDWPPLG